MPSQLSPQWLFGNSCTWAHDENVATVHHVPKRIICQRLLYIYIIYIYIVYIIYIYVCVCVCIVHIYNALENSLENATGGVFEKVMNKNPDLVKLELYSLQLY